MNENHIKGFPAIKNKIMIVGTTATVSSKKRGMYYTSKGGNDIWKVIDACVLKATDVNPGFNSFIENQYKAIALNNNEIEIIETYLDNGLFLKDADDELNDNLNKLKELQKTLFKMLEKYNIGFCDSISECDLIKGSSDTGIRKSLNVERDVLLSNIKDAEIVILNGISNTPKQFKKALNIKDDEYEVFKKQHNIMECLSTSGANRGYQDKMIEEWKGALVQLFKKYGI